MLQKTKSPKEQLESFSHIQRWAAFSREEVEEVMKETGGFIIYCRRRYAISFRPARKAFSSFVFERSGCKVGDYKVSLVDPNMVHPYREWE